MSVAFRNSGSNTGTTSVVLTDPGNAGDLLIVVFSGDAASSLSAPDATWVLIDSANFSLVDGQRTAVYYKVNGAGAGTYTFTAAGATDCVGIIAAYSGVHPVTPVNINGKTLDDTSQASPITISAPSVTTTADNCMLLWIACTDPAGTGTTTYTIPGGYTSRRSVSQGFSSAVLSEKQLGVAGASGAGSGSATTPANSADVGYHIALWPAPPSVSGIVFQSATTAVYSASGGASVAPTFPSGIVLGDMLIMLIGMKPSAANGGTVTTPAGWTLVTSLTGANDGNTGGYTTTLGADTGNCNLFAYSKVADGTETGTLSVTVGTNGVCWGMMFRFSNGTKLWDVAGTTGKQTTTPTSPLSIAFAADPGVKKNDHVIASMCIPTDVTTPAQFSSESFTQTGVTFGTLSEVEEPDSTTGNDIGGVIVRAAVTGGPASAAPTFGSTLAGTLTNVRGPAVFLRIRERLVGMTALSHQKRFLRFPHLCM